MDLDTARTLTLIAMVFQGLSALFGFFVLVALLLFMGMLGVGFEALLRGFGDPLLGSPLLLFLLLALLTGTGLVPLVLLILTYLLVYARLSEEMLERVFGPALALGIASLILSGVVSGILLIVAYVKAKDAHLRLLGARGHISA